MKRRLAAVATALACTVATPAFARPHHSTYHHYTNRHHYSRHLTAQIQCDRFGCKSVSQGYAKASSAYAKASPAPTRRSAARVATRTPIGGGHDPRPRAWCGWWMRHYLGVADRSYNLARNWAHYGMRANGPGIGTIVVWRGHVGIITGRTQTGWVVKSGNDDHAVRERERSLRGAIAFRLPTNVASR